MNYLTLVNKENKIKESFYKKVTLIKIKNVFGQEIKIEEKTYLAYQKLKQFLEQRKIEIEIEDGFRPVLEQRQLYEEFVIKYGEAYAKKYVASPGSSEHHTGMGIDLTLKVNGKVLEDNNQLFQNEDIFLQIHKYLKDFGFILRYPKGKENVTGYPYEPWHIRYVGKVPATIMDKNNLTLEEYLKNYSGILIVNKEKNITSRDVVNKVSKILGIKKIGHTGTLDPMAEGVLVLTIGKATKLGELLTSTYKEYIAGVQIGKLTDTLDITGKVIKEKSPTSKIDYLKIIKDFKKTYLQEVPIYSAVKVDGKKLYEYARSNIEVKLPKKKVTIKELELLEQNDNNFKFKALVSKGTYIRSLIRDMGESIDEYFIMNSLIRTKQGKFSIEEAYTLKDIERNHFNILKIDEVLDYPIIKLDDSLYKKVSNGAILDNTYNISDKVLMKDKNNNLVAIYQNIDHKLKIYKMINNY